MKNLLIVLTAVAFIYGGCTSSSAPCPELPDVKGPYTISGHLIFKHQVSLPADAKVICYWGGLNSQPATFNSSHVFGEGSLNMADSSFSLTFNGVPPNTITIDQNCKKVMVSPPGYILLVSSQMPGNWFDSEHVLGAVDQSAMIYCVSNTTLHSWYGAFVQGYGIGKDTSATAAGLIPIPNTGLTLTVDSLHTDFQLPDDWIFSSTPVDTKTGPGEAW